MAKNTRKNFLDANEALNTNKNTEVVEMNREVVMCTECGVEIVGESIELFGNAVCESCFNDINKELEILQEQECTEVQELAESIGDTLSDVDELRNAIVEEQFKNINKELTEAPMDKAVEEFRAIQAKILAKQTKLNAYISNAITHGKTNKIKGAMNCITRGQLIAIARNYKVLTGGYMTEERYNKLKKLDGSQAHFVEIAIKQAQSKAREHNFNKRILEAQAKRTENTNA